MKKCYSRTVNISSLSPIQKERMYLVFSKYYQGTSESIFYSDLENKDYVFLLLDKKSNEIVGFSTIVKICETLDKKEINGFFSGDTILEREYWGQGVLGVAFLKFLFIEKLKNPSRKLYWFLITKGIKTYLLMANNFPTYYPRYDKSTPPKIKKIIDSFSLKLFQPYYDSEDGIIRFPNLLEKDSLRPGIAPITDAMREKNPKIPFFEKRNPNWELGEELSCVAEMTFFMPFYYQVKTWWKSLKRLASYLPGLNNKKKKKRENFTPSSLS